MSDKERDAIVEWARAKFPNARALCVASCAEKGGSASVLESLLEAVRDKYVCAYYQARLP